MIFFGENNQDGSTMFNPLNSQLFEWFFNHPNKKFPGNPSAGFWYLLSRIFCCLGADEWRRWIERVDSHEW